MLEMQTQKMPTKMVASPKLVYSKWNIFVVTKPKNQNVLWSRLPTVSLENDQKLMISQH